MFHMTNDAGSFKTRTELEKQGFYAVAKNCMKKGSDVFVPLYEGKMVQAYDHRAASVVINPENVNRPAQPEAASSEQHRDPNWLPTPQFWVDSETAIWPKDVATRRAPAWAVGFKDVTAPTNVRTMIAAMIPYSGVANTLPIVLPKLPPAPNAGSKNSASRATHDKATGEVYAAYPTWAPLLLANFNSLPFDYIARQKV
jgi:hypothetical protein